MLKSVAKITQGGAVGAPVGGQVLSEEDVKKQVEVPDIEGLTIEEAIKALKDVNLELQIKDEPEEYNKKETIVKEQLPKRGISIYEGTKVIVTI